MIIHNWTDSDCEIMQVGEEQETYSSVENGVETSYLCNPNCQGLNYEVSTETWILRNHRWKVEVLPREPEHLRLK